jgi:hypothetical protein
MWKITGAMAFAMALAAGQSNAATITVDGIGATWGSVVTAGNNSLVIGTGTSELRWGKPVGGAKSGYGFVGQPSAGYDVEQEFKLGTFTHYNNPIEAGTSIKETTLSLAINLTIEGAKKSVSSAFKFLHNETPNLKSGSTCANGGSFGTGVNVKGCADQVTIKTFLSLLEEFQVGNAIYTMQITGFLLNGVTVTDFWTKEEAANSADLMAKFTKVRDLPPPPPPPVPATPVPVPLPASGLLFLAGLAGLAMTKRRRS